MINYTHMLKSVSNESLLDMYVDNREWLKTRIAIRDYYHDRNNQNEFKYYDEKCNEIENDIIQIKTEILRRMSGLEID